jgi:DNA-directed RNA polymerase beta subunit
MLPKLRPILEDSATRRDQIRQKAVEGLRQAFPMKAGKFSLELGDVKLEPKEYSSNDQKRAILEGRSLAERIRGDVTVKDAAGTVVDTAKNFTLMQLPYFTPRHTFIVDGTEYSVANQLRQKPGVYVRRKDNEELEGAFNLSKGANFKMLMDPEKGLIYMQPTHTTSKIPLHPVLRALGIPHQEIANAWGPEVANMNRDAWRNPDKHLDKLYEVIVHPAKRTATTTDEKARQLREYLDGTIMDPEVNAKTLGHPYDRASPASMLSASKKLLDVYRSATDVDDRDSLEYKTFHSVDDFVKERIGLDAKAMRTKLGWKLDANRGDLKKAMPSGPFTKSMRTLLTGTSLSSTPSQINPLELIDQASKVTMLGEGAIPSERAIPMDARDVHPTHMGILDPSRTPECYDDKTEVFTYTGWKRWIDVSSDDKFACRINGRLEFHSPFNLIARPYKGTLYGLMTNHIEYLVTPNHRVLCKPMETRGHIPWRVNTAEQVHNRPRVFDTGHDPYLGDVTPTTFQLEDVNGSNSVVNVGPIPMEDWAAFMGWYLSEGCYAWSTKHQTYQTLISQNAIKNPINCKNISVLLDKLPWKWCFRTGDTFCISSKQLTSYVLQFGHAGDKFIPEYFFNSGERSRRNLFNALLLGDGRQCVNKIESHEVMRNVMTTGSTQLARDFIRLAATLGYATSHSVFHDKRNDKYLPIHEIRVQHFRYHSSKTRKNSGLGYYKKEYNGMVYCAEVPGGLLYVRRNDGLPIWSGNSFSVGVDLRAAIGARRDDNGDMYAPVVDVKTGKPTYLKATDMIRSVVAFPGEVLGPGKLVDAMNKGKVEKVNSDKVTHQIEHVADLYGPTSNLLPLIYGIQGNRVLMASKHQSQAMPLVHREPPLVQTASWNPGKSVEQDLVGLIVPTARHDGVVSKIDSDYIHIRSNDGVKTSSEITKLHYDTNFPLAAKTALNNTLIVKEGDKVKEGQPLAESNFTKDGQLALGTNLRVAYMPYRGLNSNDAIVISQSAANKLTSEHVYQHALPTDGDAQLSREKHRAYYGGNYTKKQYDNLDEKGVVKTGTVLNYGDPIFVGVRPAKHTGDAALLGKLSKSLVKPFEEVVETWNHDGPGEVLDVANVSGRVAASIKTTEPMRLGDKMCFDQKTEVLTRAGWKKVADVTVQDEVCTLYNDLIVYEKPTATHVYPKGGRMYRIKSQQVDFLVTENHQMYVKKRYKDAYELEQARHIYTKRVRYAKSGKWVGERKDYFEFPALQVKAGQGGRGWRTLPPIRWTMNTYLMILGAYISEGNTFDAEGSYGIDITQIKMPNREDFINALDAAGLKYSLTSEKIRIYSKQLMTYFSQFGLAADKYLPNEVFSLTPAQLHVLLKWLVWGDGSLGITHGQPCAYFTVSKRLADDVQRLCLHTGWAANTQKLHDGGEMPIMGKVYTCQPYYRVGIITRKLQPEVNHGHVHRQKTQKEGFVENYKAPVYCVTVPSHVIYTRRNGKTAWSGNSNRFGGKGIVGAIIPDNQIIHDEHGRPVDVILTSAGIVSRINPAQITETLLGKAAEKAGKPYVVPQYEPGRDNVEYARQELKKHGLSDKETVYDPATGRKIPGVTVGKSYFVKLMKTTDTNWSARGAGAGYDYNEQPAKGGDEGAKGIGRMEHDGLVSHNARNILYEASAIKGQKNDEFWRAVQLGLPTPAPKTPFVFTKLVSMLQGAGVKVDKSGSQFALGPLTDNDISQMSSGALTDPYKLIRAKDLRPEKGGLFDPTITGGMSGTKWAHVDLAEPIVNPVFEEPVRRLLGLTQKQFDEKVGVGGGWFRRELAKIDVDDKLSELRESTKKAKGPALDGIIKQVKYLEALKSNGLTPDRAYVLSKVPVTPPVIRPILPLQDGKLQVGDANILYKDAFLANDQLHGAKEALPSAEWAVPRKHLYDAVSAVFGVGDPVSPGAAARGTKGYIAAITGTRPGSGFFNSRIMKRQQDVSGRATIAPDPTLNLDEIGVPSDMLFQMYGDFVIGRLVKRGYPAVEARRLLDERAPAARQELLNEARERPVFINRAPSLNRFNIVAAYPRLINGKTLKINPFAERGLAGDYDGDAVQVHAPVTPGGIEDAKKMTLSNLIFSDRKPGTLNVAPEMEAIMGLHKMTKAPNEDKPRRFASQEEAMAAYHRGEIDLNSPIEIKK